MSKETEASRLRLAELMATLALATDLARGQPLEHKLRTCLLAVRLGELLGLGEDRLSEVYYVALLRWIGCTGHAHELSLWMSMYRISEGRISEGWVSDDTLSVPVLQQLGIVPTQAG